MEPTPPNGLCEDVWRGSSRALGCSPGRYPSAIRNDPPRLKRRR